MEKLNNLIRVLAEAINKPCYNSPCTLYGLLCKADCVRYPNCQGCAFYCQKTRKKQALVISDKKTKKVGKTKKSWGDKLQECKYSCKHYSDKCEFIGICQLTAAEKKRVKKLTALKPLTNEAVLKSINSIASKILQYFILIFIKRNKALYVLYGQDFLQEMYATFYYTIKKYNYDIDNLQDLEIRTLFKQCELKVQEMNDIFQTKTGACFRYLKNESGDFVLDKTGKRIKVLLMPMIAISTLKKTFVHFGNHNDVEIGHLLENLLPENDF